MTIAMMLIMTVTTLVMLMTMKRGDEASGDDARQQLTLVNPTDPALSRERPAKRVLATSLIVIMMMMRRRMRIMVVMVMVIMMIMMMKRRRRGLIYV